MKDNIYYQADYYSNGCQLQLQHLSILATSKTKALRLAKQEAKNRNLRFLELVYSSPDRNMLPFVQAQRGK